MNIDQNLNAHELVSAYRDYADSGVLNFATWWNAMETNRFKIKDTQKDYLLNGNINFGATANRYVSSLKDVYGYGPDQAGSTKVWLNFFRQKGWVKAQMPDEKKSLPDSTIATYQNMWFEITEDKSLIVCVPNQGNINVDVRIEGRSLIIDTNNE